MIRIVFYIDTTLASGGAEKVLRDLVNNMDPSRFDITVITPWPEDSDKYLAPHIHYHHMYPAKDRRYRLRYRAETALGLTHRLHIGSGFDIEAAYLEAGPTKVIASSRNRSSVKLAWVHCELDKLDADPDAFRKKAAPWYRKFDRIVCVSESVRDTYRRMFGPSPESVVVHNVVDSERILERSRDQSILPLTRRRPTVVTVGRMYPQKGYDRLLKVHRQLLNDGVEHDLWILGEGPQRQELENYIKENDLEDSVRMPGFLANPYAVMSAADLVVCSSLYEGFSTVVTEALILGRPVVTTPCAGMAELLGDDEFGIITDDLYEGLKRMLTEPDLLAHYAAAAQRRGRDFQKEALVQKTEEFFLEILEGTKKS